MHRIETAFLITHTALHKNTYSYRILLVGNELSNWNEPAYW